MERRKRAPSRTAQSRVSAPREGFLPNISELIDSAGQVSVGGMAPIKCAAVANDEDQCYAMLQRRRGETLQQLLERLDAVIETAIETEQMIDEINAPPDTNANKPSRRR